MPDKRLGIEVVGNSTSAQKAFGDLIPLTKNTAASVVELSQQFKNLASADIAKQSIAGLKTALDVGKISADQYQSSATKLAEQFGLATPKSTELAGQLVQLQSRLADGKISSAEYATATAQLATEFGKAEAPAQNLTKTLGDEMLTGALRRVGDSAARFVQQLPQMAMEMVKLGVRSEATQFNLTKFAGSEAKATEYMGAFAEATDFTVDKLSAMEGATKMLQMGLVSNSDEMATMASIATKLGDQTIDTGSRISDFAAMLANQSIPRLDNFGISSARVRARIAELKAEGKGMEEAFKLAVLEQGRITLDRLGDTSDLTATDVAKLTAAVQDAKIGFGEMALSLVAGVGGVDQFAGRIRGLPGTVSQLGTIIKYGANWLQAWGENGFDAAKATWAAQEAIKGTIGYVGELNEKTGRLTFTTNEEVKALLSSRQPHLDITKLVYDEAQALEIAASAQAGYANMIQPAIDQINIEKLALLGLNETLMDASATQIAQVAIDDLTQAYNDGKISADDYAAGVTVIQLNAGLATPASIALNEAIASASQAMRDGQISTGAFATEIGNLGGKARGTIKDVDELGKSIRTLPDGKTIHINTMYTTTGRPSVTGETLQRQGGGYAEGLTKVGEAGWEYLMLPKGSYVFPHSESASMDQGFRPGMGGGGGGITYSITNNFGPGSIRSDWDIVEIVKAQNLALQMQGRRGVA